MVSRIRLGDLLVRAGVLTSTQLSAALTEQKRWGGQLGRILVEMNFISEPLLVRALSKQLGMEQAKMRELKVPSAIVSSLDFSFLRKASCCPLKADVAQRVLWLAMADPTNLKTVDEIRFRTGYRVEPLIAGETEIGRAIDRLEQKPNYPEVEIPHGPPANPTTPPKMPVATTGDIVAASYLRSHQARQERALRVMVDLLIEKGLFTREEYLELLKRY